MAPTPTPATPDQPRNSTESDGPQSTLPGMKRGIAIGVACCIAVLIIALPPFFALRRRKRLRKKSTSPDLVELPAADPIIYSPKVENYQEIPLVEAEARPIYELDAGQVSKPSVHISIMKEKKKSDNKYSPHQEDETTRLQQRQHNRGRGSTIQEQKPLPAFPAIPQLLLSPPNEHKGEVSPLLSPSNSLYSILSAGVSPLQHAQVWDLYHDNEHRR